MAFTADQQAAYDRIRQAVAGKDPHETKKQGPAGGIRHTAHLVSLDPQDIVTLAGAIPTDDRMIHGDGTKDHNGNARHGIINGAKKALGVPFVAVHVKDMQYLVAAAEKVIAGGRPLVE